MHIEIHDGQIVFERMPGSDSPRLYDLRKGRSKIRFGSRSVMIDSVLPGLPHRYISKFDRFGNQEVRFYLYGNANVDVAEDNMSYEINGIQRKCDGPVWHVYNNADADGELVILQPSLAPDPTRNLYRYNSDGSFRWQIGSREHRPDDAIDGAVFLSNGNVRARAALNGWSVEVDDASGRVLRLLATNEK